MQTMKNWCYVNIAGIANSALKTKYETLSSKHTCNRRQDNNQIDSEGLL